MGRQVEGENSENKKKKYLHCRYVGKKLEYFISEAGSRRRLPRRPPRVRPPVRRRGRREPGGCLRRGGRRGGPLWEVLRLRATGDERKVHVLNSHMVDTVTVVCGPRDVCCCCCCCCCSGHLLLAMVRVSAASEDEVVSNFFDTFIWKTSQRRRRGRTF